MAGFGDRARRAWRKLRWEIERGGPGRPRRILTVPTANGVLSFSNMDLHNARNLYIQRAWEVDLITRTMAYLGRDRARSGRNSGPEIMVDVGANIGMICIAMLKHGYFGEAIAFEPGPENFALLRRNIAQNGMEGRIRPFQTALSDSSGEVEMELSDVNFGDHRVRSPRFGAPALMSEEGRSSVRVPARTLDEALAEGRVDARRIGLIWVDIQGHEGYLFRGARTTLSHGIPVLSEFWPYGILRSGLDRETYAGIIESLFARFVIVEAAPGRFEEHPPDAIAGLFDRYPRPEQNLELILFPR